jgi:cystathionine beta-lyase/cystathionine gamma-synthase
MDPSFPQFELAKRQMTGACGLLSFYLKTKNRSKIITFCESLGHIMMAVSWGGHESLIIPKLANFDAAGYDPSDREHRKLRLYIGLEDASYLINDLEKALSKID